jgi:Fe2+ transport system protein FeoA
VGVRAVGDRVRVVAVRAEHAAELGREGIRVGVELAVEGVAPLGGPVVVRLGSARVALARSVARTIAVTSASGPRPGGR